MPQLGVSQLGQCYILFEDLDLVRELPAGCAEVLLVAAAPMPSAGITLRQTDNLFLPVLAGFTARVRTGACA